MTETTTPIITKVGKIWGRDAIFLDQITMLSERELQLKGEFNSSLCSDIESNGYLEYTITFFPTFFVSLIEYELDTTKYASAFDLVENSKKLRKFLKTDEISSESKHFIFRTYDTVFEIIAIGYELELGAFRHKNNENV